MIKRSLFVLLISSLVFASEQFWAELGDFKLENGETLIDCKIGYRTYGEPNSERSNIILFPTWFGGISAHLGNLVGPTKMLDSSKYFIIAIDALGNGISTSPSNSEAQPGAEFPNFTILDMVNSQHRALTEKLNIQHLHAIVGGSMGGMQTFQWIVAYPDFMDKALPYVGAPWQTAYGRLVWETELLAIESGLEYNIPLSVITEQVALVQVMNAYTPAYRNRKSVPAEIGEFRADYLERFSKNFQIHNWAAQLKAMMAHDITQNYGNSQETTVAAIRAELFIIVSAQDHLVNPGPALKLAALTGAGKLILDNDCGHLAPGCDRELFYQAIHQFLDN